MYTNREMAVPGLGRMTSAELLEIDDGKIVGGELIYDAEAPTSSWSYRFPPCSS
jgi:hypothetical protein